MDVSPPTISGYCDVCPTSAEVQAVLGPLGFRQTFALDAQPAGIEESAAPAQFYFEDAVGTQVCFLAGRDTSRRGSRLPPHASRFLIYAGGFPSVVAGVRAALEQRWSLLWQPSDPSAPANKRPPRRKLRRHEEHP